MYGWLGWILEGEKEAEGERGGERNRGGEGGGRGIEEPEGTYVNARIELSA